MQTIKHFRGEHDFLSNFYPAWTMFEGRLYPSSEAAFQAAKTKDTAQRKKFEKMKPAESKEAGRLLVLRADWEDVKIEVMRAIVLDKFTRNADLREKLLATGDARLIEGNWWNDKFWGVCQGVGLNWLGKILEETREVLKGGGA